MSYPLLVSPLELAGCVLWLDAQDFASITQSGGLVSAWNDKSGLANHAVQATPANQPTYSAAGFGGLPCIDWGSNTVPARVLTTPDISIGPHTLFIVLRGDGGAVYYSLTHGATAGYLRSTTNWCSQILRGGIRSARDIAGVSNWLADGKRKQVTVSFNGLHSSHKVVINGAAPITTDAVANDLSTTPLAAPFYLGNNQVPNSPHIGVIAEVIVFNRALSDGERVQVEQYLARKWALYPLRAISAPTELQGCALWLDAQDAASITQAAGLVSQWADKSGNNKHAVQAVDANKPSYSAAGFGGYPCLDWGSAPPAGMGLTTPNITFGPHTAFFVLNAIAGHGYVFGHYLNVSNYDYIHRGVTVGWAVGRAGANSYKNPISLGSMPFGSGLWLVGRRVLTRTFDGSDKSNNARLNGLLLDRVESGVAEPGTATFAAPVVVGNYGSGPEAFRGTMAEVVLFDRMLSDGERALVERYLAKKWNLYPQRLIASPLELPNCALWLDATDAASITLDGSSNVSQWNDKSGNANHAAQSSDSTKRPSMTTMNGQPALRFDGTNDILVLTSNLLGKPMTTFAVAKLRAASTNAFRVLVEMQHNCVMSTTQDGVGNWGTYDSTVGAVGATELMGSGARLLTVVRDDQANGNLRLRSDGVRRTLASGNALTSRTSSNIGAGSGSVQLSAVDLGELIVFNRALTDGETAQVEQYLAKKYNLAGM